MLNKLKAFLREQHMLTPGDRVVCAVSGGADSMALLWAMYLLKDELQITLSAAHFNHRLRGAESDRDEAFVREFCAGYKIPLSVGSGQVVSGKKGLEAAAREARYAFLRSLSGKIATAHTADDNAETILLHLVRGTGLKGLGGIAPINGAVIRPMLSITRTEVLAFLEQYHVSYVEDSSNGEDDFLRNRLRHNVMPLLKEENPRITQNLSAMAQRLRQDAEELDAIAGAMKQDSVSALRALTPPIRSRVLSQMLQDAGVREPEAKHIAAMEKLVFSDHPSAKACFSEGVIFTRCYDQLQAVEEAAQLQTLVLQCPGVTDLPESGLQITCSINAEKGYTIDSFPVKPQGTMVVRGRKTSDTMRLYGGTKSLKKLFIDRKIPAAERDKIPVIADEAGVLAVPGIGANLDRICCEDDAVRIQIEFTKR